MAWKDLGVGTIGNEIKLEGDTTITMLMLDPVEGRPQYGISRVYFSLGGSDPVPGIAMVARFTDGSVSKYATSDWDHAKQWYLGRGALESDLAGLLAALQASDAEDESNIH
jgi:hypothetical protein